MFDVYRTRQECKTSLMRFRSHGSAFNINIWKDKKVPFGTMNGTLKPLETKNMTCMDCPLFLDEKWIDKAQICPMETDPNNHTKKRYPLKEKQNTLICVWFSVRAPSESITLKNTCKWKFSFCSPGASLTENSSSSARKMIGLRNVNGSW